MDRHNSRTLLVKAASFLGVAGLSVLISLPGLSQQSPNNTSPMVPSTVKPTNPGGTDAGTTNGGENLNRVPSSGSTTQQNRTQTGGQNDANPTGPDPSALPPSNRVEGRDQNIPSRTNSSPNGSDRLPGANQSDVNQPGVNQPGATTGGDSTQQVEQNQNGGSTLQQRQTTPQGSTQPSTQQSPQSDSNSGSTTDDSSAAQQEPNNGSVRALW